MKPIGWLVFFFLSICLIPSVMASACIQVVPGGAVELFWLQVKRGAEDAGQQLGYTIYFRGAKKSRHASDQRRIVDMIWQLKCHALVVAPSMNYDHFIEQTHASQIPVVFIDRMAGSSPLIDLVATDNYAAGVAAGQYMASRLGGKGRVVLLRLKKGITSTDQREQGFLDTATALGLTIVHDSYISDEVGKGRTLAKAILQQLAGQFDAIFTPNETTTTSVLLALEGIPHPPALINVGFDISSRLLSAIKDGEFTALMVQRPYDIGYKGVAVADKRIRGMAVAKYTDTGFLLITRQTMLQKTVMDDLKQNYPDIIISSADKK